jgi:hypothetical protein
MAVETEVVFKHNLNTNSIEEMCIDLSNRFKATIVYTYSLYNDVEREMKGLKTINKSKTLLEIKYPDTALKFIIEDEYYLFREFYKKHGDAIFEDAFFKKDPNQYMIEYITEQSKYFYCFLSCEYADEDSANRQYGYAFIYDQLIYSSLVWLPSWWSFCRLFTIGNYFNDFDSIQEYRVGQKEIAQLFGADEVIYISEQGDIQYLRDDEAFDTFEKLLTEIKRLYPDRILDVPSFMQKKELLKIFPVKSSEVSVENKEKYKEFGLDMESYKNKLPLVFYDNFADLK